MADLPLTSKQGDRLNAALERLSGEIARAIASRPGAVVGTAARAILSKDRRAMEALLPVICSKRSPRTVFFSSEVVEFLESKPDVVDVVFDGSPLNENSARRLGKLLGRVRDVEIAGYVVRSGGDKTPGTFWSLERV